MTSIAACAELEAEVARTPTPECWLRFWLAIRSLGATALRESGFLRPGEPSLQLPAGDPYALVAAGRYAETLGDWSSAVAAFERAHALRSRNPAMALCRAHALARLGRLDEADRLFSGVGKACAWPARTTRMGDPFWRGLDARPPALPDGGGWEWLVPPPDGLSTVVLVSMDGGYAQRYAARLLASWKALQSHPAGLHLHIQLVNTDQPLNGQLAALAAEAGHCSAAVEAVRLPALPVPPTLQHMAEHRTWFACARLRVLPWWLERVTEGVVVTDVDIEFLASPLVLWRELGAAAAGAVRFDPRARSLWEEWYLTLALFRASTAGRTIARDLAHYVAHFLDHGEGLWSLDQAALWSCFARHGGAVGLEAGTGAIAALSPEHVQLPGRPRHPDALLRTSVGSLS